MEDFSELSDDELTGQLVDTTDCERAATVRVLYLLREAERRMLYAKAGRSSLFKYAVKDLKYTEPSAWRRIHAMQTLRDVPTIKENLLNGSISMSAAAHANQYFQNEKKKGRPVSAEEKRKLLYSLEGKSDRAVNQALLDRLPEKERPLLKESVKQVSSNLNKITFYLTNEQLESLRELQAMQSNKNGKPTWAEFVMELTEERKKRVDPARVRRGERVRAEKKSDDDPVTKKGPPPAQEEKRKHKSKPSRPAKASNENARKQRVPMQKEAIVAFEEQFEMSFVYEQVTSTAQAASSPISRVQTSAPNWSAKRTIRSEVKRDVYRRAGGRCEWINDKTGERCGSRHFPNFDHVFPVALGGSSEVDNVRYLCRNHNLLAALLIFGPQKMGQYAEAMR